MDLSNIRIREHFGLVTNDTKTNQFSFLVSVPKNKDGIEVEDYVVIDHPLLGENCPILAVVKDIASYEEVAGSTIGDRIGRMMATAKIVGYVDMRNETRPLQKLLVPPAPGARVYVPFTKFIEDTFNRNAQGKTPKVSLHIGKIQTYSSPTDKNTEPINYYLNAEDLTTKHTLIAAITNAGKTPIAKIIIEELANKTQIPIVILDHAGEYINIHPENAKIVLITTKPEKIKKPTIDRITIKTLNDKNEKEILQEEIKPNQITLLNGQGLTPEEKQIFYTNCLKTLMKNRSEETIEPFFLMVEEADTLKGETLTQLLTEARKTSIAICLITTHPIDLGGKILTQIGTLIIGKTTDKDDIAYLRNMLNKPEQNLTELKIGEWVINGINIPHPNKILAKQL
jgi:DNA helicase HerA-like ATPase